MVTKHSGFGNASWAQCPSKKFNTNGGYSGEERDESNETICHLLIDDEKYNNNDRDFNSAN